LAITSYLHKQIYQAGNEANEPKQEQTQLQFHTSGNHGNHTAGRASSCDASHLPSLSPRKNFSWLCTHYLVQGMHYDV